MAGKSVRLNQNRRTGYGGMILAWRAELDEYLNRDSGKRLRPPQRVALRLGAYMDFSAAISEPFVWLIGFHNAFNRNIKVSFGALEMLSSATPVDGSTGLIALPTGTEPWGRETRWRNLKDPIKDAARFLAEISLARATAAFEDYLISAKAEFDRAGLTAARPKQDGTTAMRGFDAILGIKRSSIEDLARMATFFDIARNCIVHRSNRASHQLATCRADPALMGTLARWPKRVGKWTLSLPSIEEGRIVDWRPRHAIMASDTYYQCAKALDRALVQMMGPTGLARMAAHWCFFADPPAPCLAKLNPETMVRSQLISRYKARTTTLAETVSLLRASGKWDEVRAAFSRRYPDGPETSLAARRRARR